MIYGKRRIKEIIRMKKYLHNNLFTFTLISKYYYSSKKRKNWSLLMKIYNIKYTTSHIICLLHRWGFDKKALMKRLNQANLCEPPESWKITSYQNFKAVADEIAFSVPAFFLISTTYPAPGD